MPRTTGTSAWAFTSTYGGGLLAGDDVRLSVHATEGATCLLSTQASTKVYPAVRGAGSRQTLDLAAGDGTCCVIAPDPITCFAGATYEQRQRFNLSDCASLILIDWITSGRSARGERWAFSRYFSRNEVFVDGSCVFRDTLLLDPADGPLAAPQRMGRCDCLAAVVLIGPKVAAAAKSLLAGVAAQPARSGPDAPGLFAASELPAGALLRVAGRSSDEIGRWIRKQLAVVPELLGHDPWSRKW